MTARKIIYAYLLIVLYTVAPILSVLIASGVANALGVKLDEGSQHPSFVLGVDIGGLLYTMFVMGWLALATIPTGVVALLAFTVYWPIVRLRERIKAGKLE